MHSQFDGSDVDFNDEELPMAENRLLLVSNRLPITMKKGDDGEYTYTKSSGGLVTGLSGLAKKKKFIWYGWPGFEIPNEDLEEIKDHLLQEFDAIPVLLDEVLAHKHYNGFSSQSEILSYHVNATDMPIQMRFSGRYFTIMLPRSLSMNPTGLHTKKPIVFLPSKLRRTYRTTI